MDTIKSVSFNNKFKKFRLAGYKSLQFFVFPIIIFAVNIERRKKFSFTKMRAD